MKENEADKHSLYEIVQKIVPLFNDCSSVEEFLFVMENVESNLHSLETRIQNIQQEIEILKTEK